MEIFGEFFQLENLFKLGQIILVDLVLAGDNAIVIGLVAARFSVEHRRKVILYGVGAAVLLRILFAVITVQLLAIKGLLLVGGLLLLWICWKLWVDLRNPAPSPPPPPRIWTRIKKRPQIRRCSRPSCKS